jgi:hypothetical protein
VSDNLNHEAVGIENEGGVAVGAVLGEGLRRPNDLVTATLSPFVDTMHVITRGNEERKMLEPNLVPRVILVLPRRIQEELRALKVLRAISVPETRLQADHWHELVEVLLGGVDIWNTQAYVLDRHLPSAGL